MNIIKVRTPFFVSVNEAGQFGSKVTLQIYYKGNIPPTSGVGFYSLSKKIASTTQIENVYNISNYIREFIIKSIPVFYGGPTEETGANWAFCIVTRFKETSTGSYTQVGSPITYVCIDGFTTYLDGRQNAIVASHYALKSTTQKVLHENGDIQYANILFDRHPTFETILRFYNSTGGYFLGYVILGAGALDTTLWRVPLVASGSVKAEINLELNGNVIQSTLYTFNTEVTDDCKYTPVLCSFINKYGGWEFLTFFKAQTNSISVKGTDYRVMPNSLNYSTTNGQTQRFNLNGNQTIKLNTGFVDENYSELITDLMLSENVLLDNKPVVVKSQSTDLKSHLKNKNINYEIEFEYAFNLINNVI